MERPPKPDAAFLEKIGVSDCTVDDQLLYALYIHSVHILITEDLGIHKKAKRVGIDANVYTINEALDAFRSIFGKPIPPYNVIDTPVYSLDISDHVFDSIRKEYPEFNEWFQKSSLSGRRAWVVYGQGNKIAGVCIYKEKTKNVLQSSEFGLESVKLCTFKVSEELQGSKIGELLLKAAFRFAYDKKAKFIYLHVFEDHDFFVNYCKDFGFVDSGCTARGELILKKEFQYSDTPGQITDVSPLEYDIRFYPRFVHRGVQKFIIPVRPQYHRELFPESQNLMQPELFHLHSPVGNAIRKAYLCHSRARHIAPGDLLCFYRSTDIHGITTLGIVESATHYDDSSQIIAAVGKRTVYSAEWINRDFSYGGLVIMFWEITNFKNPVRIREMGIPYPQTISRVADSMFCSVLEKGGITL